jgi:hypothetical protein
MSAPLRVTLLHFTSLTAFSEAFALILDSELVASCTAEPELARIRFLAPARCAEALVHEIYQRAGLRWCSQHDAVMQGAAEAFFRGSAHLASVEGSL